MAGTELFLVTDDGLDVSRLGLAELLMDAVQHGASVGFLEDLDLHQALAYVDGLAPRIARGELLLWVVQAGDRVVGSVQLSLCLKPNGLNRGEVQKLLVHSGARRHGLGRRLMAELEMRALKERRGLVYLDTEAGSVAEAFYRRLGYVKAGEIPDYACGPGGIYGATALYWKRLLAAD